MKKKFILFPLVVTLLAILMSNANGPGSSSGVEGTGASGSAGCSCHNTSSASTTSVSVTLLNGTTPVTSYVPGASYTIRMQATNTGSTTLPKFGFQVSARTTSANAGVMSAPTGTHTVSVGGVNLVEHGPGAMSPFSGTGGSGTIYRVDIPWTAPATGSGSVTLRGVANLVNNNGSNDGGDLWNNASATVGELGPITGPTSVCSGTTITLANILGGGTWAASGSNATIGASSGIVTGVTAGTSVITYTAGSNSVTATITVNTTPTVSGTTAICQTLTSTLTGTPSGGTWASGSTGVATVSSSGVVTGVGTGTAVITYTGTGGCFATTTVTVSSYAPITGGNSVCMGNTLSLSNATGGGTWSGSNSTVATISSSGVLTPVAPGTTTISYAATGACTATQVVTVNALPSPFALSGGGFYCSGTAGANICLCAGTNLGTTYQLYQGSTLVATLPGTGGPASFGTFTTVGSYSATGTTTAGCNANMTGSVSVSVNPSPAAITGTTVVCQGSATTLANTTSGGTWSSNNITVAFVGSSSGIVTGLTAGTATISYILTATGCSATTVVTVSPVPTAITGTLGVCAGFSSTLASTPSGGTWTSSNTTTATIDPATGVMSGLAAGTTNISYTLASSCRATAVATVNQIPVISGTLAVCSGLTTTLSATPLGGTWTSGNTAAATIGTNGVVTGTAAGGTATISYVSPAGCLGTAVVTVNTLPVSFTGTALLCAGSSTTLSSVTTGGSWSSSAPGIATVNSAGVVSGVSGGTAIISYTLSTGCYTTGIITVNPAPAGITGTATLCPGTTTTLSTTTTGGTWSSSGTGVATVSSTGVVTGVAPGTADIIFTITATGCTGLRNVTVNPNPASIGGTAVVCEGSATTLTSATTGGTWTSGATSIATVNFSTGVVSGIAAGNATITYLLGTGCLTTKVATVNPLPAAILGATNVCAGGSVTLTDATSGGTWSSSSSAASIGTASGVLSGASAGTATISYTLGTSCYRTFDFTVNALPAAIGGTLSVCQGSVTTLSNTTAGGSWSSGSTSIATVGSANGLVSGVAAGTTGITYTLSTTGCSVSATATVNALPAAILGTAVVCPGATTTLTNATTGGSWSSANTAIATVNATSGVVTGVASGTTTIIYTLAGTGCQASTVVTVSPSPNAGAISGTTSICTGTTATFTNTVSSGTWSASNTNASVNSLGIVTGNTAGAVTISYSVTNSCGTAVTTFATNITNSAATGSFGGITALCPGGNGTVTNGVTGGVWTSTNTSVAAVGSLTGLVSAVSAGTTTLSYTVTTSCGVASAAMVFTVNPLPSASTGALSACVGTATTLSNTGGGTWTSGNTGVATVGSATGVVTGTGAGTANITYTLPTGCTTASVVTINPLPLAITGSSALCEASTTSLANATTGGSWSSTNAGVATINSTGVVTSVAAGTTTISYTLGTGCARTMVLSVNPLPSAFSGTLSVCPGNTTSLGNTISGGSWTSGSTSIATIAIATGVVNGVAAGTSNITYTLPTGCRRTGIVTVNALPAGITGSNLACVGATNTLADATSGGTWISGNTTLATIGSTSGIVTGVAVGSVPMTYMLSATGCISTTIVTVNPAPAAITGTASICAGATSALADADAGGTWTSSNTSVAPVVFTSGVLIGSAAGNATITYTLPTGCKTTRDVTINAIPPAIGGTATVCAGLTTTLTNAFTGGSWSTAASSIATIDAATGVMTGVAPGNTTITFTSGAGCTVTRLGLYRITSTVFICGAFFDRSISFWDM